MHPNGYVLHETDHVVVISTNHVRPSKNAKTGDMIQVWILSKRVNPVDAVNTGKDALVCGTCVHRGDGKGRKRSCYVNVSRAPLSVWKAYRRGSYPRLALADIPKHFAGRAVRLGSYGDPTLIPVPVLHAMVDGAANWTGYTHQWRSPFFQGFKPFLMASVDSVAERVEAAAMGWRTFRVTRGGAEAGEVVCPATTRAHKTCATCGLCKGTAIKARSVAILVHGIGAGHFNEASA